MNPLNQQLHLALGMSGIQRRAYLLSLLPTVNAIERLAPALAGTAPNAEYPWPIPNNPDVIPPVEYGFSNSELMQPKIVKVTELLRIVFQHLQQAGEI